MREAGIEAAGCRGDMALAVRRMILQMDRCEIAFVQIGNSDWRRPCARWRPPTFRNVYSPKTPQSAKMNRRVRAK
jgi:hypothetical protein